MDPRTHKRFLEYRETFQYYRAERKVILDRETWLAYDVEYLALEARPADARSRDEESRRLALKRVLLRD